MINIPVTYAQKKICQPKKAKTLFSSSGFNAIATWLLGNIIITHLIFKPFTITSFFVIFSSVVLQNHYAISLGAIQMQLTIPISKSLYFKLFNLPTLISHITKETRLTAIIHSEAGLIHVVFFIKPANSPAPLISKINVTNANINTTNKLPPPSNVNPRIRFISALNIRIRELLLFLIIQ